LGKLVTVEKTDSDDGFWVSAKDIAAHKLKLTFVRSENSTKKITFSYVITNNVGVRSNPGIIADMPVRPSAGNGGASLPTEDNYTFQLSDFHFSDPHDTSANSLAGVTFTSLPTGGTLYFDDRQVTNAQMLPPPLTMEQKNKIGRQVPMSMHYRVEECLSFLDEKRGAPKGLLYEQLVNLPLTSQARDFEKDIAEYLTDLACTSTAIPFVARGLILSERLKATGPYLPRVFDKLKNSETCPGAKGLRAKDFVDYGAGIRRIGIVNLL
jgi:hypothetical protein